MSMLLVRQKIKEGSVDEAAAAVRELFTTLTRASRGRALRVDTGGDSATFVILLERADGSADPRPTIPADVRFQEQLQGWVAGPPVIEPLDVVGSYSLFGAQRAESAGR
jgi:hypothetical protein